MLSLSLSLPILVTLDARQIEFTPFVMLVHCREPWTHIFTLIHTQEAIWNKHSAIAFFGQWGEPENPKETYASIAWTSKTQTQYSKGGQDRAKVPRAVIQQCYPLYHCTAGICHVNAELNQEQNFKFQVHIFSL